jgi:hypothetical protein
MQIPHLGCTVDQAEQIAMAANRDHLASTDQN